MAQQQRGQQQQTSLDALLAMLTEQGRKQDEQTRKLDAFKADWDKWRDEMPDNYTPRRETEQTIGELRRQLTDHESRIRTTETQIASAVLSAYKDTTATRERVLEGDSQTRAAIGQHRQELDGRTLAIYSALAIAFLYIVANFASAHLILH